VQIHETDVTSLIVGLVFLGITGVWVLVETGVLTLSVLPVVLPALLVVVGVVGVAAAVVRSSRQNQADDAF
jgi:hypothetical protein